ncbi:MAG: TetR/AcrR family transcriptional regulator [Thermoguttaceae bacterium]
MARSKKQVHQTQQREPLPMRELLAQVALELFSTQGLQNVNLDMVCARAGVTKGAFYCHYASKKELILAVCDLHYHLYDVRLQGLGTVDANPVSRLRQILLLAVEQCLFDAGNRLFTSEIFAMAIQDDDIRKSWGRFLERNRVLYTQLLEDINERGYADIKSPRENAEWLLSLFEGLKHRSLFDTELTQISRLGSIVESMMQAAMSDKETGNSQ